ncbi:peptide alpha-N-acetyltransferase [Apiospora kogelbergensis]|uniref:Peptide alpha-N-acetyltransferase n=1 Tax=Apiospora kogelbergensis TaxID=1337665 RepID=A0AAW0R0J4_9PEZI
MKNAEKENIGNDDISEGVEMATWGVEEAEARNKAEASLGTQLALAYAIHKSFIFIRVPLTAAVTPKVVKVLRSWGWNIGKRASKTKK